MHKCEQNGCTGHMGKFDSCRDEALYYFSLDGTYPNAGNVEFEGHFTLVHLESDMSEVLDTRTVMVPKGIYMVIALDSGAVAVYPFETLEEAQNILHVADVRYAAWENEEPIPTEADIFGDTSGPDMPDECGASYVTGEDGATCDQAPGHNKYGQGTPHEGDCSLGGRVRWNGGGTCAGDPLPYRDVQFISDTSDIPGVSNK